MARKKGRELDSKGVLLDAAWQLLLEQGVRGMSVDAIVARGGLSKGTFFHFFSAKQDFLDALCARIAETSWRDITGVLQRRDLDPVARLDLLLQESRAWRSARTKPVGGLWRELARDENAALLRKVVALGIERLSPVLAALIDEGNARGLMRVADVEVVARLVAEWISATAEGSLRLFAEGQDTIAVELALRRANATIEAVERTLGMAEHSLKRVDRRIVSTLAADIRPLEP
jgi:AcrR family transcriptional regulator